MLITSLFLSLNNKCNYHCCFLAYMARAAGFSSYDFEQADGFSFHESLLITSYAYSWDQTLCKTWLLNKIMVHILSWRKEGIILVRNIFWNPVYNLSSFCCQSSKSVLSYPECNIVILTISWIISMNNSWLRVCFICEI